MEILKTKIEERFGMVFDEEMGNFRQVPIDRINLIGHCGEVSNICSVAVQGEIRQIIVKGLRPSIFFEKDGQKMEIASGFTKAVHCYVVDQNDKVWDPITGNWGNLGTQEYLKKIS